MRSKAHKPVFGCTRCTDDTGTTQRFPAEGEPAPLTVGSEYYLYVAADVGIPITRCLLTYQG